MNNEVVKLLELQGVDGRLQILKRELETRPGIVESQDYRVIQINQRREQLELAKKACKMEIDRADLELGGCDDRIKSTQDKVSLVKTNQEYTALNHQIERIEEEKGEIEEKVLELWDDMEKIENELASSNKDLEEARKVLEIESREIEAELKEIRIEIEKLEESRREACEPIDDELLGEYERLFGRYGANAVVSSENKICAGCHMSLSPQIMNLLSHDDGIVACTNCARLLYS